LNKDKIEGGYSTFNINQRFGSTLLSQNSEISSNMVRAVVPTKRDNSLNYNTRTTMESGTGKIKFKRTKKRSIVSNDSNSILNPGDYGSQLQDIKE
jgi:hypothetical protein